MHQSAKQRAYSILEWLKFGSLSIRPLNVELLSYMVVSNSLYLVEFFLVTLVRGMVMSEKLGIKH